MLWFKLRRRWETLQKGTVALNKYLVTQYLILQPLSMPKSPRYISLRGAYSRSDLRFQAIKNY